MKGEAKGTRWKKLKGQDLKSYKGLAEGTRLKKLKGQDQKS